MTASEIISLVDSVFPLEKALSWDNCGLQVGDPKAEVRKVLICLEPTEEVVSEAAEKGVQLIVSHHPLIFRPLKRLDLSEKTGKIVRRLLLEGIALCSFHTNVDVAEGGLADFVAKILGLKVLEPLTAEGVGRLCELEKEIDLEKFVETVKTRLSAPRVRVVFSKERVKRVALCPGSGGDLVETAFAKKADCLVTGDVKYHQAEAARGIISVVDAGHFYTELPFCQLMADVLRERGKLEVLISSVQKEPFSEEIR